MLLEQIVNQNAVFWWFNFLGSLIAIVLGIEKILEIKRKRVLPNIKLEQENFISRHQEYGGSTIDETIIDIKVDLRNTGLEPTTLVDVDFYSDNKLLNGLKMRTRTESINGLLFSKFDEIRIEHNDRKTFTLSASKDILLPNAIKELKAELIFKTAHKDISKKIKLIRKDG